MDELARHIRTEWDMMRNHRNSAVGWNDRLLHAQRVFNGEYDDSQLMDIKQFGGSEVYARIIALKCRGASALLREVYLTTDKPWGLDPSPDPTLPDDIMGSVQLLCHGGADIMVQGQPPDINAVRDRTTQLITAAQNAGKEEGKKEAKVAEAKLDDRLVEGGFYAALTEFLTDIPLFPFACIKGPVVRVVPDVVWQNGEAVTQQRPRCSGSAKARSTSTGRRGRRTSRMRQSSSASG
jgi:hypothetical protein